MIKATLVLLIAHLIIPRLQRRSAAERHALWVASLATAVILPLLGMLLPSWQPDWAARVSEAWPAAFGSGSWTSESTADIVIRATALEGSAWTVGDGLSVMWIAGSTIVLLALGLETMKLRRFVSSAVIVSDAQAGVAWEVARAMGLARQPRLFLSRRAIVPLAWGVVRPRVLLPEAASDWSDDRLRAVLAHELAHVQRGDWLVHLLAELVCAVYWFHPLIWSARNQMRRQSERAADDLVLTLGTSGTDYASHLLAILREAQSRPPASAVAMGSNHEAGSSHLERRVAALLDVLVNRATMSRARAIAIALVAFAMALPFAALGSTSALGVEVRTAGLPPLLVDDGPLAQGGTPPLRHVRVMSQSDAPLTPPEIVEYTTPPLYSDEARRRGVEGVVTALAHIDASGAISQARVVKGLDTGLDANALVALRQWQFRAGMRAGVPAAMDVEIDIEFTLRNEAINAVVANDMVTLVGPGVTPPRAVRTVRTASTRHGNGTVVLDVVLLEDGTPRIVRVLRSLTPAADESAARTFEQWRFSPALKDGHPVKVRMQAEVSFHD
jgi:TonB family protein